VGGGEAEASLLMSNEETGGEGRPKLKEKAAGGLVKWIGVVVVLLLVMTPWWSTRRRTNES